MTPLEEPGLRIMVATRPVDFRRGHDGLAAYAQIAQCFAPTRGLVLVFRPIREHVFGSFLALVVAKDLTRLCDAKGLQPECQPLLNDLDRLQQATIEKDGKTITTRIHATGQVGAVFQATGVAIPANIREQAA